MPTIRWSFRSMVASCTSLAALVVLVSMPATALASEAARPLETTASVSALASETVAVAEMTPAAIAWKYIPDDHPWLRWGGAWSWESGQNSRVSRSPGAWVSATFSGTAASLVSGVGPDRGRVRVYVDGVSAGEVSLYATSTASGVPVWQASGMKNRTHTVKVVVLGTKDAASAGSRVDVDTFGFVGKPVSPGPYPGKRVQNGDPRLYRKGSWSTIKRKAAFGDSAMRTTRKGASVELRFKGTSVTWFGRKDPSGGDAEVWLDGRKVGTVSQYSPTAGEPRAVWAASALKNKTHTLTIKSLGGSRSGGGAATEVDAFQVGGSAVYAPRPTPFKYPWRTYIVIDKSSYKLYWVKDKVLVKVYPIAHGKSGWATPERVWRIDAKYHTSPGSVYGPRKMRMFKRVATSRGNRYVFTAYAIHGTNQEWVIGTRASHGCIRMYNKDVRELFPQVPKGTMVVTRN